MRRLLISSSGFDRGSILKVKNYEVLVDGTSYEISEVSKHPEYNSRDHSFDFALIKTSKSIALPPRYENYFPYKKDHFT